MDITFTYAMGGIAIGAGSTIIANLILKGLKNKNNPSNLIELKKSVVSRETCQITHKAVDNSLQEIKTEQRCIKEDIKEVSSKIDEVIGVLKVKCHGRTL